MRLFKKLNLDPYQFGEGQGTAGGEGQGADGAIQGTDGADQSVADGEGQIEQQTEEIGAEEGADAPAQSLDDLLNSNEALKSEYDKKVQQAIRRRFKTAKAVEEENSKYKKALDLVRGIYPDAPEGADELISYLDNRNDVWANAAAEKGMPVEAYKNLVRLERENAEILGAQRAEMIRQQREEKYAEWDAQVPEVQAIYPNFDMQEEIYNDRFMHLLTQGWNVKQAYEATHVEDIVKAKAAAAAKDTAARIKNGQNRPIENGAGNMTPGVQSVNPANLSEHEMEALVERIKRGERISFD